VRRPDEVEDLAQDVFVKAFQELPKLRDRGTFGPWLGRLTTVTDDPKVLE
jgi:DNA-directed RNA polymerase specialized sigma24 family protein